jgi:hypothetical protein
MFNLIAPILLALAIVGTLGTQLATTAYRNTTIPRCADCQAPARELSHQFVRAISPNRPA